MGKKGRRRIGDRRGLGETVGEDGWISGPPSAFRQPVAIPALSSWPLKVFFGGALCPKEKNSSFPKSFCDWSGTELKGSLAPPCLLNAVILAEVLRALDRFPTSSGRGLLSGDCLSHFVSLGSLLLCYMM